MTVNEVRDYSLTSLLLVGAAVDARKILQTERVIELDIASRIGVVGKFPRSWPRMTWASRQATKTRESVAAHDKGVTPGHKNTEKRGRG